MRQSKQKSAGHFSILQDRKNRNSPEYPVLKRYFVMLFLPQRVKAAMQTLNRYKSQDALRRLRKSDPEIATYIERFVQKSKEKDK